jgi:hypothetical protein
MQKNLAENFLACFKTTKGFEDKSFEKQQKIILKISTPKIFNTKDRERQRDREIKR